MNDTIYSAEFAKQLCDEYNSVTNQINRAIKEAVSNGKYYCTVVIPYQDLHSEYITKSLDEFRALGYRVSHVCDNSCPVNNSVKMLIKWD